MQEQHRILITRNGGAVVSGESRNKVLDALLDGTAPLHILVSRTGLAKSTVYSILNKLVDEGIVQSSLDPLEGRVYHTDSMHILSLTKVLDSANFPDHRWDIQFDSNLFKDIPRICLLALLTAPGNSGIDLSPIYINTGARIAQELIDNSNASLDAALNRASQFLSKANICELTRVTLPEYVFDMYLSDKLSEESCHLICTMVVSMLREIVFTFLGKRYEARLREQKQGFSAFRISLENGPGTGSGNHTYHDVEFDEPEEGWPTLCVGKNGGVFVSGLWSRMMDGISSGLNTLTRLSKHLQTPTSTVAFNLDRMISSGLIRKEGHTYVIISKICLRLCKPTTEFRDISDAELHNAIMHPESAYRHLLFFIITDSLRYGIDLRPTLYNTGHALAMRLHDYLKSSQMSRTMAHLTYHAWWFKDCNIEVLNKSPFTVSVTTGYDSPSVIAESMNEFYAVFFQDVIRLTKEDDGYTVSEAKVFGEGNRRHRIVLANVPKRLF